MNHDPSNHQTIKPSSIPYLTHHSKILRHANANPMPCPCPVPVLKPSMPHWKRPSLTLSSSHLRPAYSESARLSSCLIRSFNSSDPPAHGILHALLLPFSKIKQTASFLLWQSVSHAVDIQPYLSQLGSTLRGF